MGIKGVCMKKLKGKYLRVTAAVAMMAVLAGCQTIRNEGAKSTEQMLSAAGFQMKLAQTPEQLANIRSMQQRTLIPHVKDGQNIYVYADSEFCQCIYVGAESNYQEYQRMSYQKELADQQQTTAEMESENFINESAMMDWDVWGPWEPWR